MAFACGPVKSQILRSLTLLYGVSPLLLTPASSQLMQRVRLVCMQEVDLCVYMNKLAESLSGASTDYKLFLDAPPCTCAHTQHACVAGSGATASPLAHNFLGLVATAGDAWTLVVKRTTGRYTVEYARVQIEKDPVDDLAIHRLLDRVQFQVKDWDTRLSIQEDEVRTCRRLTQCRFLTRLCTCVAASHGASESTCRQQSPGRGTGLVGTCVSSLARSPAADGSLRTPFPRGVSPESTRGPAHAQLCLRGKREEGTHHCSRGGKHAAAGAVG